MQVHDLSHLSGEDAYDKTQSDDEIKDGDIIRMGNGNVAILVKAWPVSVTGYIADFHTLTGDWEIFEGGKYAAAYHAAIRESAK